MKIPEECRPNKYPIGTKFNYLGEYIKITNFMINDMDISGDYTLVYIAKIEDTNTFIELTTEDLDEYAEKLEE